MFFAIISDVISELYIINDANNYLTSTANLCDLLHLEYFILVQHLFLT